MNHSELRREMSEICAKMYSLGWVAATDGNVSAKTADGSCSFLVTPSGVCKGDISPEMLIEADSRGNGLTAGKVSSEFPMHLRCYRERADVGAVVHAHPPCATAFAVAGLPLNDFSLMEAVLFLGSAPLAPYATPSTEQVGESIAPLLAEHDAILLQNHGAVTVGADLATAFRRMETLEMWAKTSLNARILGGAVPIPPDKVAELVRLREVYGRNDRGTF